MKSKKQLIIDTLSMAKENIPPAPKHLEISLEKGEMLAEHYHADKELVSIGICLMDIKLSDAIKGGDNKSMLICHTSLQRNF